MHRLCLELKIPHPDFLYEMLSPDQIEDWVTYFTINGFDSDKEDARIGLLASTVYNMALSIHGKAGAKMSSFSDFIFDWDITKPVVQKVQSTEDMKQILLAFARDQNKRVEKQQIKTRK